MIVVKSFKNALDILVLVCNPVFNPGENEMYVISDNKCESKGDTTSSETRSKVNEAENITDS